MASQSVDFLSDKPCVSPTSSTNHKEDIIRAYLQELKIAYKVMAGHPDALNEFVREVKGDSK
jgi:hypothetical protein